MSKLSAIKAAIESGKSKQIAALVQDALDEGISAGDILNRGMIPAMSYLGEQFKHNEVFVPELLVAARTMKKGVEVLTPHLKSASVEPIGKLVIGTVAGDLHDIGKNLVAMMLEGAGFEVTDLGVDVSAESFISAVEQDPAVRIVALSSLLTTTMPSMQHTVEAITKAGLRERVKIMVGGAPVSEEFASQIGADGYAGDAASAAELAARLIS